MCQHCYKANGLPAGVRRLIMAGLAVSALSPIFVERAAAQATLPPLQDVTRQTMTPNANWSQLTLPDAPPPPTFPPVNSTGTWTWGGGDASATVNSPALNPQLGRIVNYFGLRLHDLQQPERCRYLASGYDGPPGDRHRHDDRVGPRAHRDRDRHALFLLRVHALHESDGCSETTMTASKETGRRARFGENPVDRQCDRVRSGEPVALWRTGRNAQDDNFDSESGRHGERLFGHRAISGRGKSRSYAVDDR